MSDPFAKHGITHLSPNSINTYAEEPAFWAFKYLLGQTDEVGPAAWRGSAVEAGLDHWLFKRDEGEAQKAALDRFELEAMGEIDDRIDRERILVFPMLSVAMEHLGTIEPPTMRQFDIQYWIDGIEVPIIGRPDYEWPTFGLDLKTKGRMPSVIPANHGRQVSVYQAARNKPYDLLYVTKAKAQIMKLTKEEHERHLKTVAWYAHNIRRGLATFSDKQELARLYPPKLDHFYWSNEDSAKRAREIWEC